MPKTPEPPAPAPPVLVRGLENVIAGTQALSFIDGQAGRLAYRGFGVDVLCENSTFEEVAWLLWHGTLPKAADLDGLKAMFASERSVPTDIHGLIRSAPRDKAPMEILRTAVSALSLHDESADDLARENLIRKAGILTARLASIVAAIHRLRQGLEPVAPREDLSHAGNFFYAVTGSLPDARRERMMDMALILHADHGYNASTFSARVTASTLSDMYSAVTAAVATLKGPLHGGANQRVMEMLEQIGEPDNAGEWVRAALARGARIFGFGHRVYKTEDPRATVLRRLSEEAGTLAGERKWHEISRNVEAAVMKEKGLHPNVDFYSASFYHSLGMPTSLFVPIFAVSRIAGWSAHLIEQYGENRLIRPRSQYVGPPIGQPWVPIDAR
jgi:citrate synthase